MSKRKCISSVQGNPKPKQRWFLGLLDSMNDPECIVKESKNTVVIKDKYPKAKIHYLILPREEISSIFKLNKDHINLLEEFNNLFEELKEEHKDIALNGGFHAVPSLQPLHMHVISNDFISPCLKSKQHWNSFTTKFFIPISELLRTLNEQNCIKKISQEEHNNFINTALQCNQCDYKPKTMPQLKEHLLSHC